MHVISTHKGFEDVEDCVLWPLWGTFRSFRKTFRLFLYLFQPQIDALIVRIQPPQERRCCVEICPLVMVLAHV